MIQMAQRDRKQWLFLTSMFESIGLPKDVAQSKALLVETGASTFDEVALAESKRPSGKWRVNLVEAKRLSRLITPGNQVLLSESYREVPDKLSAEVLEAALDALDEAAFGPTGQAPATAHAGVSEAAFDELDQLAFGAYETPSDTAGNLIATESEDAQVQTSESAFDELDALAFGPITSRSQGA